MSSVLETLMTNVATALRAIRGSPDYSYSLDADQVQRRIHRVSGTEEITNEFNKLPVIIVVPGMDSFSADGQSVGSHTCTLPIDIWMFVGPRADCEDLTAARRDLYRALFHDFTGFGVGARVPSYSSEYLSPVEGLQLEGVRATLTLTYSTVFGDPDTRD